MKTKKITGLVTLMILFFSFQLVYAWSKNYGMLQKSLEVNRMFLAHQVSPDYRYFYSGPDAVPNAIIGIHKDFTLESRLWKPVELTPDQLKDWFRLMFRNIDQPTTNWGANILGPGGEKIGIWFSRFNITTIKLLDNNRVQVHTPNPGDDPVRKSAFGCC